MRACQTARPLRKHKAKTVKVPLTRGQYTLIDKADEQLVRKSAWCVSASRQRYARSSRQGRMISLHRLLVPTLPGFEVDHIDGNPLNNTRANLRVCTVSQNHANSPGQLRRKSRFKNVSRATGKWQVLLHKGRRNFYFGRYTSEILAGCVADDAGVQLWGEFAWLNFPKMIPRNFLRRFITQSRGRIMSVTFYKRRNSKLRTMRCRVGVVRNLKGGVLAFNPKDKGLISVYDMQNKRYRFIPTEGVLCLTYRGQRYRVTPDPKPYPAA